VIPHMPAMALIKSKRENMNIVNTVIDLGPQIDPCAVLLTHDEESGLSRITFTYGNETLVDHEWGIVQKGNRKYKLGATSHGLTQLYLMLHHNLIATESTLTFDYYVWQRPEILKAVKEIGLIYNGDEWWDKLEQSHFRLPVVEEFPGGVKVVMVLTSSKDEHKATYTISTTYPAVKDRIRLQMQCANYKMVCGFTSKTKPVSIKSVYDQHGALFTPAKAV
jgi:hypothetical protein